MHADSQTGRGTWQRVRLGEVLLQIRNGTTAPQINRETPYPVSRIETISEERVDWDRVGYLAKPAPSYELQHGDILYSHINSVAHIGKVAIYEGDRPLYHGMNLMLLRIDLSKALPQYCFRVLESPIGRAHARRECKSAINQASLGQGQIMGLTFDLPPLSEQRGIAEILDTVDEAIRKTEQVVAKLQQVKQGLLHDLLTRGIDENGELRDLERHPEQFKDSPLGLVPRGWKVVHLRAMCETIVDCPHSTPTYVSHGVPCIRTADMIPGELLLGQAFRVSEATYRDRTIRLVPIAGDIIYSREGERLGIAAPVGEQRVCLGQRVMHLRPARGVDPTYLVWAMNAPPFYKQAVVSIGSTTSPHVNIADITQFLLCKPCAEEQARIGRVLAAHSQELKLEQVRLAWISTEGN